MSQVATSEAKFFDLHTTGIGYLHRIREVQVRRGKPFMACDISALHGSADDVEYTRIDCRVSGEAADKLVRRCWEAVNTEKKVLVAFRIGDLWIDPFLYEKGEKKGQPGASLKGRLLFLAWIKVDGELVYKAKPKDEVDASDDGQQNDDSVQPSSTPAQQGEASQSDPEPAPREAAGSF